jgi:hypothetical protein
MTILTSPELTKIASNSFTLDFVRAKLVQQASTQPKVYEGSGSISQNASGALQLKLYCRCEDVQTLVAEIGAEFNGANLLPGQLVGADNYYAFEGVDLTGQTWTASDVAIDVHTGVTAGGRVVHAKRLRQIQSRRASTHGGTDRAILLVPGSFRVPFTHGQSGTQEAGFSACTLNLGDGETASLKTKERALVVELTLASPDPMVYTQRLLEALGIAIGARLRPQVEVTLATGERLQTVRSLDDDATRSHRLLSPIPTGNPADLIDFQTFVVRFMATFDKPYGELAGYWFRVLFAFGNSLENQALVLSTAIEGLLKAYFPKEMEPDAEYVKQLAEAKPLVKALAIGERARQRLLGSLGNAKDPTPSNALHKLEKQQRIPDGLRSIWKELRNKMSHADELQWGDAQSQLFINDLYGCLELFHRLLMLHIAYEGRLTCFSKVGWPDEPVTAFKNGTTSPAASPVVQPSGN